MADARVIVPRGHLSHIFNHGRSGQPRNLQYRLVHYGFWSTGVMLLLMLLDLVVPSLFESHYVAIGIIYLCFQLAEIASRNPLKQGEVNEGIIFSLAPSIVSLLLLVLNWKSSDTMLTGTSWDIMVLWFVFSWIGFIDGLVMAIQILGTPYRRNESAAPQT